MTRSAFLTGFVTKSGDSDRFSDLGEGRRPRVWLTADELEAERAALRRHNFDRLSTPSTTLSQKAEILSGSRIVADVPADLQTGAGALVCRALRASYAALAPLLLPIRRWWTSRRIRGALRLLGWPRHPRGG